jgi:hypothetical protein
MDFPPVARLFWPLKLIVGLQKIVVKRGGKKIAPDACPAGFGGKVGIASAGKKSRCFSAEREEEDRNPAARLSPEFPFTKEPGQSPAAWRQ